MAHDQWCVCIDGTGRMVLTVCTTKEHISLGYTEHHADGLVQDCSNSSALAMELLQSCIKLSM